MSAPCACPIKPKCEDTRGSKLVRRRRYRCSQCAARWSTCELPVEIVVRSKGAAYALKKETYKTFLGSDEI